MPKKQDCNCLCCYLTRLEKSVKENGEPTFPPGAVCPSHQQDMTRALKTVQDMVSGYYGDDIARFAWYELAKAYCMETK
jgi:hypothetical protein